MNAGGVGGSGKTIIGLTMTDTNLHTVEIYETNEGIPVDNPLTDVTINPSAGTIVFGNTYTLVDGAKFYVKGIDKAGNTNSLTFTVSVDGTGAITGVTPNLTGLAGFIDGVSEFAGNTVRRVRGGLSAVAATFSGGGRRSSVSTTAEPASRPRQRIAYQGSRERAEEARSPAVESTLNSRQAITGGSSAGAAPAQRETARTGRAPEREGSGIRQSENVPVRDAETAGESLAAVSFRGSGGLAPAALTADRDDGMRGAAFFLAAFALLTAAAVFFMVRMRIQAKKSKDDTGGRFN
jgi:hypothetical protein